MARGWQGPPIEQTVRLMRGMRCFLKGVKEEALMDEIVDVTESLTALKIVKDDGYEKIVGLMRGMTMGGGRRRQEPNLVWLERGGSVWHEMAEKARIVEQRQSIVGGESRKNNFVNTRIIGNNKNMTGKRGRSEGG